MATVWDLTNTIDNSNPLITVDDLGNLTTLGKITSGSQATPTEQLMQIVLTSAQIKTLNATPLSILAAPGAGKIIAINTIIFANTFGTIQYTRTGATFKLFLGTTADALALTGDQNAMVIAAASAASLIQPSTNSNFATATKGVNKAIFIGNDGGSEFAAGDGTIKVTLVYTVITL